MNNEFVKILKWRYIRLKQFLKVRILTINKKVIDLKGIKVSLGDHVSDNIKEALLDGYYEAAEFLMVEKKLVKEDVVMEIGAGIGFISTYCAKKIGSKNIYTFEANPSLEAHIRKNYELNNVSPNLEICLLAEKEGKQSFFVEKDYWSSSMIRQSNTAKEIKIPMRILNDKIHDINPSFLIIDIEGGEYELFQYIDFYNIKKISIELHNSILGNEKINEIKNKLNNSGYNVVENISNTIEDYKEELFFEKM